MNYLILLSWMNALGYLRNFEIPIPPLPEQKKIVALLDQAYTAIDQAKANIEKNIVNAKELFQSKLNEMKIASVFLLC